MAPSFEPTAEKLLPDLSPAETLAVLARCLWRDGYDDGISGHITINQHDGTLLCSPWLLRWSELLPHQVLRIDLDGDVVEGDLPVPPGIPLHLELHRQRPGVEIALHSHPLYGTVWADLREVPVPMDQSSATGGGRVVLVDEYQGGVNDVATARTVVERMGEADIALLVGHGVFVVAGSVGAAYHRAYSLELRCRNAWHVRVAGGGPPSPLSDEILAEWERRDDGLRGMWEAAARAELAAAPELVSVRSERPWA